MGNCCRTSSQVVNPVATRSKLVPVGVPDYAKFQTTITAAKEGRTPGVLHPPCGVAIDKGIHAIRDITIRDNLY